MSSTTFTNGVTVIEADWLNEVDHVVYDLLDGSVGTSSAARSALEIATSPIFAPAPTGGDILEYNSGSARWEATTNPAAPGPQGPAGPIGPIGPAGPVGPASPAGAVQARRSTAFSTTGVWSNVTLDSTDVQTDSGIVQHDGTNTNRLNLNSIGTWDLHYKADSQGLEQTNSIARWQGRIIRVSDSFVIPGSFSQVNVINNGSFNQWKYLDQQLIGRCFFTTSAPIQISLQMQLMQLNGSTLALATQNVSFLARFLG